MDKTGHPCEARCIGGRVEVCPNGHRGNCPCRADFDTCDECNGKGSYFCDDLDCELCGTVREDMIRQEYAR